MQGYQNVQNVQSSQIDFGSMLMQWFGAGGGWVVLLVLFLLFLLFRELVCWYYKTSLISDLLQEQLNNQKMILIQNDKIINLLSNCEDDL